MKKNVVKNKQGFTIIELLIASVIIATGLLAVVSMIFNAFSRTVPLSSNLTASHLTQEGFEIVRRIRDTNFNERYSGENGSDFWLDGLMDQTESGPVSGGVDYESEELETGKEDDNLYIDDNGLFSYDSGGDAEETTFQREVTLERNCFSGYSDTNNFDDDYCGSNGAEYVLVTVTVTWKDKGETKTYEASTHLFNWY